MASQNATNPWKQCFLSRMLASGLGDDCVPQLADKKQMPGHVHPWLCAGEFGEGEGCCLLAQKDLTTTTERTPKSKWGFIV
jgi:hypothetical protein